MSLTSTNVTALLLIWGFVMIEIVNSDQQCLKIRNQTVHSQHEELIPSKETTYKPMILAVGLKYDNETTKLNVSVYVGFPEFSTSHSVHSKPTSISAATHFTNYEIFLFASKTPPPNCDDFDIKHSSRNVHNSVSTHCNGTLGMSNGPNNGNTIICIDADTRNFTIVFNHVYSAYYKLHIQPKVNANGQVPFECYTHYQTNKNWTDAFLPNWRTHIDMVGVPDKQSIRVKFKWPKYLTINQKIEVHLMRATGNSCTNRSQQGVKNILTMDIQDKQDDDTTFSNTTPGNYCAVIEPLDERCFPSNTFWIQNKDVSCIKYTENVSELKKFIEPIEPPPPPDDPQNVWIIFYYVCAFAVCLLLGSLLGMGYRHHQKERKRHRAQQSVLVEWGARTEVSPTDIISHQTPASRETLFAKHSVLLLYRRDDAKVSIRATELRKRLQFDCGNKIKIYDYGDESQWDEMSTEGPSWLPNRIYGNHIADGCVNRVIVIQSPKQLDCQEKLVQSDHNNTLENTNPLLEVDEEKLNDDEFLYGIRLLQSLTHSDGLYRRVFNVRYTDIVDCESSETENFVYADLTIAPFTCYLLPGHYKKLLEHVTSTQ